MVIDLDQEIPDPQWPKDIKVQTFKEYSDLRAIFAAITDAFKDHWGYVESDQEERFKRWQHFIENSDDFDPELWFIAMDGDEIAGVAICLPRMGENSDMAVVETLGVRRPWRRRGLALALLQQSFISFKGVNKKQAGLGVDADSLTGATRLYEKAGMHVAQEVATYEKVLRPGEEISVQNAEG
jgi:predicted N-acetyltransferase YhbS